MAKRVELWNWLGSLSIPSNPLVSRVIVNRVWQHLLGRGIVPSVDNFGVLGQPPTHPELLDYLADAVHAGRLVAEAADPADRAEQHVSAGVRGQASQGVSEAANRSAESAVSPPESASASKAKRSAMRFWRSPAGSTATHVRPQRAGLSDAVHARPRPARGTAARSTATAGAASTSPSAAISSRR